MTAELIEFLDPGIFFVFLFLVFAAVFVKANGRADTDKEREMEQIRQEMAQLRERMDKQYADLTLILDDLRGERRRQTNREAQRWR